MSDDPSHVDYPTEAYDRFLFYAEADLRAAERVLEAHDPFWHEPCFLAREAAEKSLKAFLQATRNTAPELHSLRTLCRECTAVDRDFGRFYRHCESLSSYQSDARYPPADDYPFTEALAGQAVRSARELFETVAAKLRRRRDAGLL